ncbi:hypothetical protein B4N84_05080 [Flavobacterium sp. IR1]|nr:hypothetical protein B4N84_05080 [Flavobacterium sp. IR1]
MIRKLLLLIIFIVFPILTFGQSIWTNPITGTRPSNSNPYTTGDVKNPNISVSGIRRGSALNASNGDNRYNAIGWNNSSLNPNSYFEFTLTPNSGYQINFNSFVYNGEAGGTGSGPAQFQVRSSLDGFTSAIGSAVTGSNTISLSNSNYQNISSSISFRIYAYGASNSNRTYSINDFTFNGEVCTVAITTGVSICQGGSGSLTATSNGNTTNAFSGSWNAETDPTALRPRASINNTTTCGFDNVSRNYTSTIFTVTTTGVYTFKMTDTNNYDGMAYIYEGNFTPGTCSGGGTWIIGDDDNSGMQAEPRMITTLTAGKIYTLISTTYGSTGTYSGNYTWNVTQPQGGQLVLSPVYWYTSNGTLIGAGSPFNPVGVTGSGLNNTNSIGTTTYYASIGGASCTRTPTNFVINGDSPTTSLGTYNFCIDNNNTQTTGNATAGQYALVNVIKGYTYTFSVGNIFTSNNEKLNILNAATDLEVTPTASNTTATGAQISNWTATFSGQIKVVVSTGSCTNIGIAGTGGITLNLTGGSNTFETQNEFGTNTWVGHIYNAGGATPEPFSANYAGYYNVPTETINENFGGDANCFPVYSNGTQRASIYTEGFAVRYKMKTTRSGCYIISITGDDGVRLFLNGTKILDRWIEQGSTTYSNVLVRFDGDDDLVFEYYENAGANIAGFSMAPFDGNVNTITAPATVTFCSNGNPDIINGSLQYSSTSTTLQNPQLNFQWQLATDAGGYANIPGATDRTYDPPAIANNTAVDIVRRFRRQVTLNTANIPDINGVRTNCTYTLNSNVVTMTTVPTVATPTVGTITNINCTTSTGSVALNGLPSGSWTIERTPDLVTVNGSGATTTLTGLAAGTYTFNVTNNTAGCKSAATANVVISDQSATTWNGTAWSNGPPTATKNVTFAGSFPITADLNACSCTINSGIGINVPSGRTLNITNAVIVSGTGSLVFENNSSLVQGLATTINANSGNITYKRNTTAMRLYDYTYWSSPVSDFSLYSLSPNTVPNEYYSYNPTLGWSSINNGAANMTAGVGYILSAPRSFSNTYSTVYNANFIGTPNNGDVNVTPIATKWNLVGNPYPSSLDARQFIIANTVPGAETIEGSLYFWTHNTLPDNIDPGQNNRYFYTSDDYAAYNLTGSLVTSKSATTEATAGTNAPSGNIASGQGFFVKALTNNPIQFKNNMRLGAINTQFFKTAKETEVQDRVWLNLTNTQGAFKQILVGYIEEATNGVDVRYDATSFNANAYIDFYSVNGAKKLSIQGRALPFEKSDVVPLGYKSTIAGEFTIAIDHAEGIFSGQQHVYLEDKLKDIIYDLSTGDYTFTTEIGTFTNRFEIRYASKTTLGTGDYDTAANTVLVSVKNKELKVTSTIENIKEVTVYDISGKLLYDKKKVNSTELQIQNLPVANQVVLVKITLENNSTQTKKVIVQ